MDEHTLKMFAQLDDNMPGQRVNALEKLRDHLHKSGDSFRGLVEAIRKAAKFAEMENENVALRGENASLKADLQHHRGIIAQWQKDNAILAGRLRVAQALALPVTTKGRQVLACFAFGVVCFLLWQNRSAIFDSWPPAVDASLTELAAGTARTGWGTGFGQPVIRTVGGEAYWVLVQGVTKASGDVDAQDDALTMHCIRVYAAPAQAEFGEYRTPSPFGPLGLWINWSQRAEDCIPSAPQEAKR